MQVLTIAERGLDAAVADLIAWNGCGCCSAAFSFFLVSHDGSPPPFVAWVMPPFDFWLH